MSYPLRITVSSNIKCSQPSNAKPSFTYKVQINIIIQNHEFLVIFAKSNAIGHYNIHRFPYNKCTCT